MYKFNKNKDVFLRKIRKISFDEIIEYIENADNLRIIKHPNQEKYPKQEIFVLEIKKYIWLVPFVYEPDGSIFLKTAFPSRKADKKYKKENKK